jgi:cadmium resistance protein CadD (predicted permease)
LLLGQAMDDPTDWDIRYGRLLRSVALATSTIVAALIVVTLIFLLIHTGFSFWQDIFKEHFLGTIGLIGITTASFATVTFLRQSELDFIQK